MSTVLIVTVSFLGGVAVDHFFGSSIVSDVKSELASVESRLTAAIQGAAKKL